MWTLFQIFGPIAFPLLWLALTIALFYGTCWITSRLPGAHPFRVVARSITGSIAFAPTLAWLGYIAVPLPASFVMAVCLADNGSLKAVGPPNMVLSGLGLLITFAIFFARLKREPKVNQTSYFPSARKLLRVARGSRLTLGEENTAAVDDLRKAVKSQDVGEVSTAKKP